jgi:rhamnulokinase
MARARAASGVVAAVDLGASSGRVMLGRVSPTEIEVRAAARFPNEPVWLWEGDRSALHWNILELHRSALAGLRTAVAEEPDLASVGVDSWAVDYALLSRGAMLATPYHYRDERTAPAIARVGELVSDSELYARNGLQFLPFNTLYQLLADEASGLLGGADGMLMLPDLFSYWLSGRRVGERTNASTTGLLDAGTRCWDDALVRHLGLPLPLLPELVDAGTELGGLLPSVARELGASGSVSVTAVGSHDTASAVVAVPMETADAAYISCGTWGLVGLEVERPVLTEQSRAHGFTNEGGVDGRVRYLHNVMGLWLLSESMRDWSRAGDAPELGALIAAAAEVEGPVAVFDVNDPTFLAPGDMPARIAAHCEEHGLPAATSRAELVRSILESLAEAFAEAVRTAAELTGRTVRAIHIVGGGAQNALLCRLTAERSGLPVLAGPVEATAIGNVLVQARTAGLVSGDLESLRALVRRAFPPKRYEPGAR